jgi:copper chaperone
MTMNKSVSMQVNGMHCGGCANKIKKSIEELGV